MFTPRPFGMSTTKAKSLMKTKRRRVQVLDGETSYAKWERMFTSRKHTLMQKACDLEISTGSQVTIVIQTLYGDAWCYASSDDVYQKLLNSEVILRNCIRADNELLYKNHHRQTGNSRQQPWAGFTGANENQQQSATYSFQEMPCSEQRDHDVNVNVNVNQRSLPTIQRNSNLDESYAVTVEQVNKTNNNVTALHSNQLSSSQSATCDPPVLAHKDTATSKNQSPSGGNAVENMTNKTKKTSSNKTPQLLPKSKSLPTIQKNSNVNKNGTVKVGHVNKMNSSVTALRSNQLSPSRSAICNPLVLAHKDRGTLKNQPPTSGNAVENMTSETKKTYSNETRKLLSKSKSMLPRPKFYEVNDLAKTRDQYTQSDLKVSRSLQTGRNTKITSVPVKTNHENRNLTRKREQPHHLLFDDSEEEPVIEEKCFTSIKHTPIVNKTFPTRNVSSSSSSSTSSSSSSSDSSDSSDSDETTRVKTTSMKDNSCDNRKITAVSTITISPHAESSQCKSAVLKASPQLRIPKSEPNCYETFLSALNHDAKTQSQSEPYNNQSMAAVPPKPPTPTQAARSGTSTTTKKNWTVVASKGVVMKIEKVATTVNPSDSRRSSNCPPEKHENKSSREPKDNVNMALKKHPQHVSKILPGAGCKDAGCESTRSASTKPKHLTTRTPARKKFKKKKPRKKQSKGDRVSGAQTSTANNKKRPIVKPCNNQNTRKETVGCKGKSYKAGVANRRLQTKQTARPAQLLQRQTARPENKSIGEHRRVDETNKPARHCQQSNKKSSNWSDNKPKLDASKSCAKIGSNRKSTPSKTGDKPPYNPVKLQNRKRSSSQSSNNHVNDTKRARRVNLHTSEAFHDPRDFPGRYSWRNETDNAHLLHYNLIEPPHFRPCRSKSPLPISVSHRFSESHPIRDTAAVYPGGRTNPASRPDYLLPINQYHSNYPNCNIRQNLNTRTRNPSEVRPLLELQFHPPRHHFGDKGRYFNMPRSRRSAPIGKMQPK